MSNYTSVTEQDRREMLAAIGVSSMEELFADIPADMTPEEVEIMKSTPFARPE